MYCNYCGKVIQDDALLCAYCGIRVGASVSRKRLVRVQEGKQIAGICAGIAEYFDVDPTVIRLTWLFTAIFTGVGFLAYLVAWIVMPEEPVRYYVSPPVPGSSLPGSPVPNGSQQSASS